MSGEVDAAELRGFVWGEEEATAAPLQVGHKVASARLKANFHGA